MATTDKKEKRSAERDARAHKRRLRDAAADGIHAAEHLRPHAAKWVAAIHSRLVTLLAEVEDVTHAARPGSVMANVLDRAALQRFASALTDCTQAAALLRVRWHDMPIPVLLALRDDICTRMFPLADEFEKLVGPDGPDRVDALSYESGG